MTSSAHLARLSVLLPLLAVLLPAATAPIVLPPVDVVAAPVVADTTVDAFAFQTTQVGREQVAALNAPDLSAALRRTPGVTITRYNAVGSFGGGEGGAVFLRGLGSSRPGGEIRTTLDGVPVGNGIFNHALLDLLPLDLVDGIEVSRRAEPLTEGNMFAGIHLRSPRVAQAGHFARASASVGSFGAVGGTAEGGWRGDAGEVYAGASLRRADGHRADSDGRLANALLRAAWRPAPDLELSYLVQRSENRATDPGALPGAGPAPTRGDTYLTEAWLHLATLAWTRPGARASLQAYRNDGHGDWLRRATSANADSLNQFRLSGLRWRGQARPWEGGEVTGGIDADWNEGTAVYVPPGTARPLAFGPERFRLLSSYAGVAHTLVVDGWQVTPSVGARHYRHQQFGSGTAPQFGLQGRRGVWRWHAGVSRALRFPSLEAAAFSTVVIPALGSSWRTLRPERAWQSEVGVSWQVARQTSAEVTLFRNDGSDRYVFVAPPPPPFRFLNLERFRTQGGEATVTTRPAAGLALFGGVSRLQVSPGDLPYSPRWSWTGGLAWRVQPSVTLNVDGAYVAAQRAASQARAAGALNTERLAPFAVWNARLARDLAPAGAPRREVFIAADNLLGRRYAYRPGYPMPRTGLTLGWRGAW